MSLAWKLHSQKAVSSGYGKTWSPDCCLVVDALIFPNVSSFCTQCELRPTLILNVWNLINNNSIFSGIIQQVLYGALPCTTILDWEEFKSRDNITDLISCMFTKN